MEISRNNSDQVTFSEGKNYKIPDNADVTVLETKNRIIIKNTLNRQYNLTRFQRISKNVYYDKETKEYHRYERKEYKSEKSIQQNMRQLKTIVDLNFNKTHNTIYITLTFVDDIQDIEIAKEYTKKFIRRLKYKYKQYEILYVYKFERQSNGRWHIHVLLRDINNKKIFMQNSEISNLWKLGYTYTVTVKKGFINWKDNTYQIGMSKNGSEKVSTYFSKTYQLFNVPNGIQLYGYSKNVELPKITRTTYKKAKEVIDSIGATLESDKTINISINKKVINRHNKKVYTKRKGTPNNTFTNIKRRVQKNRRDKNEIYGNNK